MKTNILKSIVLATLLSGAACIDAETLSPGEALGRAMGEIPFRVAPRGESGMLLASTTFTADSLPAVYLFTPGADKGFVVVGADSRMPALLGYAENTPLVDDRGEKAPAMEWWLGELARRIENMADNGNAGSVSVPYRRPERDNIHPLCTTLWNQAEPFNDMCPKQGMDRTYTGCVATAMAQVMKYHNWPETGQGSHGYQWGNKNLSMKFENISFKWDKMLDSYYGDYTREEGRAVAQLMYAAGISVDMAYSTSGSGAQSMNIAGALGEYFRYDKGMRYLMRDYYQLGEWEDIIYASLRDDGPVIYDGQSFAGGHSFVCDGYQGDGYFHFNWGWGGVSDGYFRLDALDPRQQGIGGSTSGFNFQQDVIVGIRPDRTGDSEFKPVPLIYQPFVPADSSLKDIPVDEEITWEGFLINSGPGTIPFLNVAMSLTPEEGEEQLVPLGVLVDLPVLYGFGSLETGVPEGIPDGRYKFGMMYCLDELDYENLESFADVEWFPIPTQVDEPEVVITVADGVWNYVFEEPAYPEVPNFTLPPTLDLRNEMTLLDLEVVNPHDVPVHCQMVLALIRNNSLVAIAQQQVIDLEPGETQTLDYSFFFTRYNEIPEGEYDVALFALTTYQLYEISDMLKVKVGTSGIGEVSSDLSDSVSVAEYTLDGVPVSGGDRGIRIRVIRDAEGRAKAIPVIR